jgi:hypothetical protein
MTSAPTERTTVTSLTAGRGRGPGSHLMAVPQNTGRCPIPGCGDLIDMSRLMCRVHWYQVPKHLRDQVWATWQSGQRTDSLERQEAVRTAIATCQERPRPAA